jgi:hypothetical protein
VKLRVLLAQMRDRAPDSLEARGLPQLHEHAQRDHVLEGVPSPLSGL